MKSILLLLVGLLTALTTQAQEAEPAVSTSRSARQKISTKNFYAPEVVETPQITFLLGDGQSATVQTDEVELKACIKTSKPLTRLSVFVNDALQTASRDLKVKPDANACDQPISQKIQLREGDNRLRIVAQNPGGSTSESFLIRFEKSAPVVAEKRLALVIGNADYPGSNKLGNPLNDATDMAEALKNVGFEVMSYTNVDGRTMRRAIDEFGGKLKMDQYQVGLFYYAGHGVQSKGHNFLVPVDAKPQSEGEIEYDCFMADRILTKMEDAQTRTNIVVLDACRDNPFERSWSRGGGETGLSAMNGPSGTYLAYATAPGKTAADGTARNGLYTSSLLKYLRVPGLSIENVFKQVRVDVMKQSNNRQTPWDLSSLTGDFYFLKK